MVFFLTLILLLVFSAALSLSSNTIFGNYDTMKFKDGFVGSYVVCTNVSLLSNDKASIWVIRMTVVSCPSVCRFCIALTFDLGCQWPDSVTSLAKGYGRGHNTALRRRIVNIYDAAQRIVEISDAI